MTLRLMYSKTNQTSLSLSIYIYIYTHNKSQRNYKKYPFLDFNVIIIVIDYHIKSNLLNAKVRKTKKYKQMQYFPRENIIVITFSTIEIILVH